jgi:adenylate cyclase
VSWKPNVIRNAWGAALGVALAVGVGLLLHTSGFGLLFVHFSYDLPFAVRPLIQPDGAVMVYMDDESHTVLQQRFDQRWDRTLHARLIERLSAAGAKAIVMDIVFSDPAPDPARDERLAKAMQTSGRVIIAADTVPAGYGENQVNMRIVTMPTDALRDQAARVGPERFEGVGSAETVPAEDLAIRQHFHGGPDDALMSLSWVAAKFTGAAVTANDENRLIPRWVNYYGPPGTIPHLSYFRALDPALSRGSLFSNQVVFVGARLFTRFAGDRKDEYRNPFSYWSDRNRFISGVEVQATMFLNLLRGDWLTRWPAAGERLALIALGILLGLALLQFRPWAASGVALGATLVISATAYWLFARHGVWFPWLLIVAQIVVALLWSIVFNSLRLYVEKRLLEQSLALHLSPGRVKQLLKRPDLLRPGAEKHTLSIMFTDIADFTRISEGMDSDELAHLMNGYFEAAISRIHETDGMVVKLIGDAIFAVWNAPLPQADHQERALRAALLLRDQTAALAAQQPDRPLRTRIGLHTGVANVGNFGSATRFDYTAIGESINLASRIEGLNKFLGTQALATGDTRIAAVTQIVSRGCGRFRLKGFEKAVEVHELVASADQAEPTRPWRETFAEALRLFQQGQFAAADKGFFRTLKLHPGDGPARFYLEKIEELRLHPPPPDWSGEVELKEK